MGERSETFLPNRTITLLQTFEDSASGDDVVVSIYDVNDANQDVSNAAMTLRANRTWSYDWSAPNQQNSFVVDFHDRTRDVHHYLFARLRST